MTIRIGTSERGGTFHTQGLALASVLSRVPTLAAIEVIESNAASIHNARALDAGDLSFGFMASNWIGRARRGEPPFARPIDIRLAAPMNAGPLFFIARADSPIRSIGDLRGRRIALGAADSGMVQHAHTIFDVLGLPFDAFTPVYLDFAAGADALASGEVDAQFQCPIPNAVMTALSERTDVRVLSWEPEQLKQVLAAVPFYRRVTMRSGAFRGVDADSAQVAVVNILATHASVPDALVQDAVAALIASADELVRVNALFSGIDDLLSAAKREGPGALEFGGVPLHNGAAAAYRAAGLL